MANSMADHRQILFGSAPKQVTFVALERRENVNGYWCYYTVAEDPENPRKYEWRRGAIDYETFAVTKDGKIFWDTQPRKFDFRWSRQPEDAQLWIVRKHGERDGLELLLEHYGLENEFFDLCREVWGWDPDEHRGVVTLLPEEMEKRPEIARELLIKHLQKKGDG